jgi:hypothetical protein
MVMWIGKDYAVTIPRGIEEVPDECFQGNTLISPLVFESESQVSRLGAYAFVSISLSSICIPSSGELGNPASRPVPLSFVNSSSRVR